MYTHKPHECNACWDLKKVSGPPILELQMDKSNHVGSGRQIKVFLKSKIYMIFTTEPSLIKHDFLIFINSYYEEILHV